MSIVKNPFDPIVVEYDQWFEENKATFLSELNAIAFFLPKQGKGVEIGAGTGRFANKLGIRYGIEPSEGMAKLAIERGIDTIIGHAEDLPYENKSFDFAIMVAVDPFVQNVEKAYQEAFRILRKGGNLIVGTLRKDGEVAQKYAGMTDSDVYAHARFHTIRETLQQLEESGFSSFSTCQTLLVMRPDKLEKPIPGHDKGSFIAINALKAD